MTDRQDNDYMECLQARLTSRCIKQVSHYAGKRCRMLARHGVRVDDLVQHLVCDAITDTALNIRPWNKATPLATHLRFIVRNRTRDLLEQACKFPACDVDNTIADPTDVAAVVMRKDATRKFVASLGQAANDNNDPLVAQLIGVYIDGITQRAHVASTLGISLQEYGATRKRLARLLTKIPDELRTDAYDVMRGLVA